MPSVREAQLSDAPLLSAVTLDRAPARDPSRAEVVPLRERSAPLAIVACHDHEALQRRIEALASARSIAAERLGVVGDWPIDVLRVRTDPAGDAPRLKVIVTAGVHGVEPAGPAAVLLFAAEVLAAPWRYVGLELTLIPLVNPVGFHTRARGTRECLDLNREFTAGATDPAEVALVRRALDGAEYHLGIDLHSSRSSGKRGYFALHKNAADLLTPAMQRFGARHPILSESTDRYVLDAAGVLRSANLGTIKDYLADRGTRWAVTVEAPAVAQYEAQVRGSAEIVDTLIDTARELV